MSAYLFFAKMSDFLLDQSGLTYSGFLEVLQGKPIKEALFKPYSSAGNFFSRASHVVTAPISLGILSLELLTISFISGVSSLISLAQNDTEKAKFYLVDAVVHFISSITAAIAVFFSPVVNLVDFLGAGVTSLIPKHEEEPSSPVATL